MQRVKLSNQAVCISGAVQGLLWMRVFGTETRFKGLLWSKAKQRLCNIVACHDRPGKFGATCIKICHPSFQCNHSALAGFHEVQSVIPLPANVTSAWHYLEGLEGFLFLCSNIHVREQAVCISGAVQGLLWMRVFGTETRFKGLLWSKAKQRLCNIVACHDRPG